jgi:hypothetical protein
MGKLIPIKAVPQYIDNITGIHPGKQTIYDWIHKGRITQHGNRVTLRVRRVGGRYYTTTNWINSFMGDVK